MAALHPMPPHRHPNWQKRLLVAMAGGLVLLMQALMLQHQLDLDHHADGEPCELCLHLTALDHGATATLPSLPATESPMPVVSAAFVAAPTLPDKPYHPRAPPRLS